MVLLYSLTLFLSAGLMFVVEPMIGKMLLPLLGGTPAVWNSCMMFFQGVLLLGYSYAHLATRWLGARRQAVLHVVVLLVALIVLPIRVSDRTAASVPTDINPIPWLLGFLTRVTGLPLFAISASAPLLQRWFSRTRHPRAQDPYFLYAASNTGSMLGLLSYPLLVERTLPLQMQSWLWMIGYGVFVALTLGCAAVVLRAPQTARPSIAVAAAATNVGDGIDVTIRRRLRWVSLAFVPSSLMLGVTMYLSTDVAPFPLLWVLPLALYLLTFILAFARHGVRPKPWLGRVVCILAILLIFLFAVDGRRPEWFLVMLHLLFTFVASLVCHGALAQDRPSPAHLTEYYLCLSFGGMLGGVFNSLVAPLVFPMVLEYPLAVILACAIRPSEEAPTARGARLPWRDAMWTLATGTLMFGVIVGLRVAGVTPRPLNAVWMFGLPALMAYRFVKRPVRFALCLAAVLGVGLWYGGAMTRVEFTERNFFGVLRITVDRGQKFRELMHGTTMHGRAWIDPARQAEPTGYYYPTGPVGQFFAAFDRRTAANVAVIGLGTGGLSCYARATDDWTFYEINPAVVRIACNPKRFAFIKLSPAKRVGIVLGDARLQLRYAVPGQYDLIILDAFNSDSIPVHLVTREAVRLYLDKLADDGVLLLHISNRRLELKPVVANLAHDAGLIALACDDLRLKVADVLNGKEPSQWVAMARTETALDPLLADRRWQRLHPEPRLRLWTDDFSNVLQVIRWH